MHFDPDNSCPAQSSRDANASDVPQRLRQDSAKASLRVWLKLGILFLGIAILLWIDSPAGDRWLGHGQWLTILLTLIIFIVAYRKSPPRVQRIMLIGMGVGLAGECAFSLGLGMYHYRLGNVPLWLAFGHGLIYWFVDRLTHAPKYKPTMVRVQGYLLAFVILYSLFWLYADHDWFGFLCTIGFLLVLIAVRESRLFFLIMFAVVAYIEHVGTSTGCWYWPTTPFGIENTIPSGNPPSGIVFFYLLFNVIVFWINLNLLRPQLKLRYRSLILARRTAHD